MSCKYHLGRVLLMASHPPLIPLCSTHSSRAQVTSRMPKEVPIEWGGMACSSSSSIPRIGLQKLDHCLFTRYDTVMQRMSDCLSNQRIHDRCHTHSMLIELVEPSDLLPSCKRHMKPCASQSPQQVQVGRSWVLGW